MKQLNFELTLQEANLILTALSKLPYEQSAGVIAKLQLQAKPQMEESKPEEKTAEEPK